MKRRSGYLIQYGVPALVLIAALAIAAALLKTKPEPKRAQTAQRGVLVETMEVRQVPHRLDVEAQGTVIPAQEVTIRPQVSGKVVSLHEKLRPGGLIEKGEPLFQIEEADFEVTVRERETALEEAKAQLALEKGRQQVAQKEWKLYRDSLSVTNLSPRLALREPQLQSARAAVEAAKARLRRARLDLARTSVAAPFRAIVREESVDLGQVVSPQGSSVTLVGTEAFWVRASIPVDKLPYVKIRGINASEGSTATIRYDQGRHIFSRQGEVIELLSDLDSAGRMARLLIRIPDPFGLTNREPAAQPSSMAPLLIDSYVDVIVQGAKEESLIELPRKALRNGDEAFVYQADGTLGIRKLDIRWRRRQSVLVASGLEEGDQVVTSPIATPIRGMKLRLPQAQSGSPQGKDTVKEGGQDG